MLINFWLHSTFYFPSPKFMVYVSNFQSFKCEQLLPQSTHHTRTYVIGILSI
jgi:hypothetical protein